MCTLVLWQRRTPDTALAVSGNRNELLARPASGPVLRDGALAPRDEQAQGTWLGLNARGLFVCVTNRREAMVDPARRSRGLLVAEALQNASARELHLSLQKLAPDRHNGFHLVYADARDAFVTVCDGARIEQRVLPAGQLHVITERSFGAGEGAREQTVRAAFEALPGDASLLELRAPMTAHASEPLESACVHAGALGYGTRSSLQLALRERGPQALWTDGHPCMSSPRDLTSLAKALLAP